MDGHTATTSRPAVAGSAGLAGDVHCEFKKTVVTSTSVIQCTRPRLLCQWICCRDDEYKRDDRLRYRASAGVTGDGEGRLLVALDDGHVLQNQSKIRQTLKAAVPDPSGGRLNSAGPMSVEIESNTTIQLDEVSPSKP